ncbi:MAG: 30S ribosomal protein S6 [Chloroflexi bacterium]|nr:30S ribosomal protein S6 [Chloroflexota bacterium]MBM3172701.1 30S ribosomal protein S6 [Chloroflexota bacterium]MBM3175489.1 30S ribosomal protein S6 [Chloroflexota bacterium]MBM4450208.1 30S ribosomal protein S6 [Chloroflexota bacterium]
MMPSYELVFILSPDVTDEEVPNAINRVSDIIKKVGGSVNEIAQWGRKKMAYPIKKFAEGNYMLAKLELKPASIRELETSLRLSGEVLRHLLIRLDE